MSDERRPIRRPSGTRTMVLMTGLHPSGRRVATTKAHPQARRPPGPAAAGPQAEVAGFAMPMTGFHVRRVFDERCRAA